MQVLPAAQNNSAMASLYLNPPGTKILVCWSEDGKLVVKSKQGVRYYEEQEFPNELTASQELTVMSKDDALRYLCTGALEQGVSEHSRKALQPLVHLVSPKASQH